jgi:two-component system, OmpR family, sensor histidine kinase CreC
MLQMIVVAAASMGLIVFVSFVAARLLRTRTAGMSIRMQIFLALALIVGTFAFGLGLMVLDRVKARADLVGGDAALGEARVVAALVAAEMEGRGATLRDVAGRLDRMQSSELNVTLLDEQGEIVLALGKSAAEAGTVERAVPILAGGRTVGEVRVVKPTLVIQRTLADMTPTVLIISLLLGVVAAGAAMLIGRAIAQPIEVLTRFAERVSLGDRRAPPPLGPESAVTGREVIRLSRAIDSMRRELQGRPFVESFAADLGHELKNPVAAIRASAEVLHDGALEEPAEAMRFVKRILEASGRIEALLGDLLNLARLEARGVEHAKKIDMGRQAELALEAARDGGAAVTLEVDGSVMVRGDATWLTRAVANLVENARLHGEDGPIRVRVWRQDREVCCTVRNQGQVHKGVRERLFRRFVTTRADRGGTGLGLAIVRAIAEAHGGQAECEELGPPEVSFRIVLPAA